MSHITSILAAAKQLFNKRDTLPLDDGAFDIMLLSVALESATHDYVEGDNRKALSVYAEMLGNPDMSGIDTWNISQGAFDASQLVCVTLLSKDSPMLRWLKREVPNWREVEAFRRELAYQWSVAYRRMPDQEDSSTELPNGGEDFPIEDLELGVRAYNVLKRFGIDTIGDLVTKTDRELLGLPKFGKASLAEVKEALDAHNLKLKEDEPSSSGGTGLAHGMENFPLSQLNKLGVRALNMLNRVGIETIGDLTSKTEQELGTIPNLRPKDIKEVKEALAVHILKLKD